jgi:predicted DCC family thiol-disulfide oxidoreductase YuxK
MERAPARVPNPPARPLLIYDGQCSFCLWWLARWQARIGDRIDYAPSQEAASRYPTLAPERFARSVQLLETDGTVYEGAAAAFRALAKAPRGGRPLWLYEHLPGTRAVTEAGYRFISRHRSGLYKATVWTWGRDPLAIPKARKAALPVFGAVLALGLGALVARRLWRRPRFGRRL